jgi:hypothetical protein
MWAQNWTECQTIGIEIVVSDCESFYSHLYVNYLSSQERMPKHQVRHDITIQHLQSKWPNQHIFYARFGHS